MNHTTQLEDFQAPPKDNALTAIFTPCRNRFLFCPQKGSYRVAFDFFRSGFCKFLIPNMDHLDLLKQREGCVELINLCLQML